MLPGIVAAVLFSQFELSASVSGLESAYVSAKAAYAGSANDETKSALVEATVAWATEVMTDPKLPPNQKYPRSLKLYREAMALDPKNQVAAENSAMIESIYKSLGKPIPE